MNTQATAKLHTTLAAIVLAAATLTATAHAQIGNSVAKANIPFAFQQGTQHMQPGVYAVSLDAPNVLRTRQLSGAWGTAVTLINRGDDRDPAARGKIVFHRYGNRYFLREVWVTGSNTHLLCPASRAEKDLQKELRLAANLRAPNGEEVAILEMPR